MSDKNWIKSWKRERKLGDKNFYKFLRLLLLIDGDLVDGMDL